MPSLCIKPDTNPDSLTQDPVDYIGIVTFSPLTDYSRKK